MAVFGFLNMRQKLTVIVVEVDLLHVLVRMVKAHQISLYCGKANIELSYNGGIKGVEVD